MIMLKSIVGSIVIAGAAGAAFAADVPRQLPLPPPPMLQAPVEDYSSGWYLRGDAAYRFNQVRSAVTTAPFVAPINGEWRDGYGIGGGAGFKAGWVRADVTVDYGPEQRYFGTVVTPGDVTANLSTLTALGNVYFDLGTWFGLSPYIGGGVGTSWVRTTGFASTFNPPFNISGDHSRWNLAYAGMAGLSYNLTRNVALDTGYRYLAHGDAQTATDVFGSTTIRKLVSHELRVGVRYMFQ